MKAVILSIGDELILGQIADTNAAWLSRRLAGLGIMTVYHQALPDDPAAIASAIRLAVRAAPVVIATGGLGPTADDLTRNALAEVLGTELVMYHPARKRIEKYFHDRGRTMSPANLGQALLPRTALSLDNPAGTAPAILAHQAGSMIFVLPGVPQEMKVIFHRHITPRLSTDVNRTISTVCLKTFGMGESQVGETLDELMRRDRNPTVGTNVSDGIVMVRIRAHCENSTDQRALDDTVRQVCQRLGRAVFGMGEATLAGTVGDLLRVTQRRLVTAESCTGGLIGAMLTDLPGAGDFYQGGWVVYENHMKTTQLGVPREILRNYGAVSESTVRAMAEGALVKGKADCALAVTGIAGPTGGTTAKPQGTVWLGLSLRHAGVVTTWAEHCFFPGQRAMVRRRTALSALNMLRLRLPECII